MGLDPNDDDYDAGRRCDLCVDDLFGGQTPKYVFASFEGVVACPGYTGALPNGTWKLQQDPFLNCVWQWTFDEIVIIYRADFPCLLSADSFIGGFFRLFGNLAVPNCSDRFVNAYVCGPPANRSAAGGTGIVTWGPDIPCVN